MKRARKFLSRSALLVSAVLFMSGLAFAQKSAPSNNSEGAAALPDGGSICDSDPSNLLLNCGFEQSQMFTGPWFLFGDPAFTGIAADANNSGTWGAFDGAIINLNHISQSVPTTPDGIYSLSFYLANIVGSDGSRGCDAGVTPNEVQVWWNNVMIDDLVNRDPFPYTQFTYSNLAGSGGDVTDLSFYFRHDPCYWHLDDVQVDGQ